MKIMKKQKGFALLEVLIAALIMTIGGIAYMRLQQVGLKYSYNNYARTQGIVMARNFADILRNNSDYFEKQPVNGVYVISVNKGAATPPSYLGKKACRKQIQISIASDGTQKTNSVFRCNTWEIFSDQLALLKNQLGNSISNSVMCYRVNKDGLARVTFIWRDNSEASKNIDIATMNKGEKSKGGYCPDNFDDEIDDNLKQNMVSIYAQL